MSEPVRYLWQQIPSTTVSEILCKSDFDGVVLDVEHGCFNNETLFHCIQVITLTKKKCLVRVTDYTNKTLVRQCLDSGADGIIFSTINSLRSDGITATDHCVYPVSGGKRGVGLTRDNFWGEHILHRDEKPIIIMQIETSKAIYNCIYDKDLGNKYPLIDYYLIGPYDLSMDLGCPGEFDNPRFLDMMKKIKSCVPQERLGYHIVKDINGQYPNLKDCGFLAFGLDTLMLLEGTQRIKEYIS